MSQLWEKSALAVGSTATASIAAYNPALGKGFPKVTTSSRRGLSPAKFLKLGSSAQERSNSALLGEGFPSDSVTALFLTSPAKL